MNNHVYKELVCIFFLFTFIFFLITLLSYDPIDPLIFHNKNTTIETKNLFGSFGSNFSGILMFFLGLGILWIPLLFIITTINFINKKINLNTINIISCGVVLIITSGSILSLKQNNCFIFNTQYPSSGILGIIFKYFLTKYFNQIGGIIILVFIWLISFIIITDFSIVFIIKQIKIILQQIKKYLYKTVITFNNFLYQNKEKIKKKKISIAHKEKVNKNTSITSQPLKKTHKTKYKIPSINLLDPCLKKIKIFDKENLNLKSHLLKEKFQNFDITGKITSIRPGPSVTTFEYQPSPNVKINKIINLSNDLALALSVPNVRIIAPIPGKSVVGIEIPNINKEQVKFIEIIKSKSFNQKELILPLGLGKDIVGNPVCISLERMPHLLIAGTTGSGKSITLNSMICSLLFKLTPNQIKFIMIDPKKVELSIYNNIPHLITPVITDIKKAISALSWSVKEMDKRYSILSEKKVKNISQYNKIKTKNTIFNNNSNKILPYIIIIIDELADIMISTSHEVENYLIRLSQMARAAGIHLILTTQRPSANIITGTIKANFPARLALQTSSKIDSRIILDTDGAESLLGNGDMLFMSPITKNIERIQGTYISEKELSQITKFVTN